MLSKIILLFLGVILFQSCNAAPYKDMDSSVRALKERLKLLRMVRNDLDNIVRKVLVDSNTIMENMLKDPKILEVKSDSMQLKLDEFRDFIKSFEEFKKNGKHSKDENRGLMLKYDNIAAKYDEKKNTLENSEDKMIAHYLKENGFVRFGDSGEVLAKSVVDKFVAEVQKYLDELSETEKKDESRILELMEAIKNQPDIVKAGSLIMRFLEEFELQDFLW